MIKELSELGKNLRKRSNSQKLIHNALKEEPVTIDIVIKEDGSFQNYNVFERKMTTAEAITAKKGKARLLLDKAEEVLCYGGESSKKKHLLYLNKIEQYKHLKELTPISLFYGSNKEKGVDKALSVFEDAVPERERKGNIAFRITNKDRRLHEEPDVVKGVIDFYEKVQRQHLSQAQKRCSICGQCDYPVIDEPHGMIKKVPRGQTAGSALISYNEDAFESYALKGNDNSGICTNCAKTYVEGLNWLLSTGTKAINKRGKEYTAYTNRKNFGSDTAMVFWTRENIPVSEVALLDAPDPQEVSNLIDSVSKGNEKNSDYFETDQFYSFTLSGAAARISVRDWIETSLVDFHKNISTWFQDIAIGYFDFDSKENMIRYSRLYDLARSCQNEKEDKEILLSRVGGNLWRSALTNNSPPMWILATVLQRARLDKRGITPERAALIKLILNRNNKGDAFMVQENVSEGNSPIAYVCGQIFAKLESIQYAAHGNLNAGIREKYFTYSMTLPAAAFGRLFNLNSKHFTKLKREKPGLAITLDKELQVLCNGIKIEDFPSTFSLEEQGQFAIGYYHQKNKQFNKPELNEDTQEQES